MSSLEIASEFIYNECLFFNSIPSFNFLELFNIMTNTLVKNNPIANGNILMSIREGIDHDMLNFVNYFINEQCIQTLLNQISFSQLKSVKREALILLTSFISKFNLTKKITFQFPLLNTNLIIKLLSDQMLTLSALRYLNSIIIYHPSILFVENLPIDFNIAQLIDAILKNCDKEVPFKIKIEASIFIMRLIDHNIINISFVLRNFNLIFYILFDLINAETSDFEFLIIILIKICSDLIKAGMKKENLQECFEENDAQNTLDECLEKEANLTNHIQSLYNLVF